MFKRSNARTPLPEEEEIVSPPKGEESETLDTPVEEETDFSVPIAEEASEPVAMPTEDIDAVRGLILELHPAIVPELISGDSVQTLIASIARAHEAYSNVLSHVQFPAGGNPQIEFDANSISTDEKIRRGLAAHQRKA